MSRQHDPSDAAQQETGTEDASAKKDSAAQENEMCAFTHVEEFLQDQNHCTLCGSKLLFKHQIDFLNLSVLEDASCGPCKINLRKRLFTLN